MNYRPYIDLFLWRSQLFEGLACGGLKKATGSWLLAASRSFNGKGAAGIQRRCELIRFWHEWRWPVRENLLSWLRWCPFWVTFLGTQKSNKTCISAQIIWVKPHSSRKKVQNIFGTQIIRVKHQTNQFD